MHTIEEIASKEPERKRMDVARAARSQIAKRAQEAVIKNAKQNVQQQR